MKGIKRERQEVNTQIDCVDKKSEYARCQKSDRPGTLFSFNERKKKSADRARECG